MNDYRLLQAHRINGVLQQPGYELPLPVQTGDWLVEQGVAERVPPEIVPQRPVSEPQRVEFEPPITRPKRCCGW